MNHVYVIKYIYEKDNTTLDDKNEVAAIYKTRKDARHFMQIFFDEDLKNLKEIDPNDQNWDITCTPDCMKVYTGTTYIEYNLEKWEVK